MKVAISVLRGVPAGLQINLDFSYCIVASSSTSQIIQLVTWATKNKSFPNQLKFCEDSRNSKSK